MIEIKRWQLLFLIAGWFVCGFFVAAHVIPVQAQEKEKAPEITLAEREAFEDLKVQDLQLKIGLDELRAKYQAALEQDPQYVSLVRRKGDVDEKLNVMYTETMKKVDSKVWVFDLNALHFNHVAKPEEKK